MRTFNFAKGFIIMFMACFSLLAGNARAASLVQEPRFSVPAGLYTEEFELSITAAAPEYEIYYTLDGSIPVPGSTTTYPYTSPIRIGFEAIREKPSDYFCGTVIRAIAVNAAGDQSDAATASYFVDSNILTRYRLPIISIATEHDNLYGNTTGIMTPGLTQNRGREWERPIHFEYFDRDGQLQLSMDAGIRLHGAASRDWAFKSFRIYARSDYDTQTQFAYDFFGNGLIPAIVESGEKQGKTIDKFKRLILRNAGNEGTAGDGTLFRDALSQALMTNTSLDLQGYSPAVTFLNGEFYGIQNIRERQDEKYIEDHYDVDESNVIIYEFSYDDQGAQVPVISFGEEADLEFYNNLLNFIRNNDLSVKENYDKVQEWLDIENFVDYQIINIFGANRDWPGNNCKAWRVRTDYNPDAPYGLDGRIRWLVYDTDFNFGLYNPWAVNMDSLSDATKIGGREWPTQDGATLFLRKLLENDEFKTYFCQRYLDLLNTNFDKDYANTLIDQFASEYRSAIGEFRERYGLLHDWEQNVQTVKDFISKREAICKSQLAGKFKLGKLYFLSIHTSDGGNPVGGAVQVNTVTIDSSAKGVKEGIWKKSYYDGLPTMITAIPAPGYEFVSWSGATNSTEVTVDGASLAAQNSNVVLTPVFRKTAETKNAPAANTAEEDTAPVKAVPAVGTTTKEAAKSDGDTAIYIICIVILVLIILLMAAYMYVHNRKNSKG